MRFVRFCLVGAAGFLLDAAVLYWLIAVTPLGPLPARALSYLAAATGTWLLNRRYTFANARRSGALHREWLHYLAVNAVGGGINYLAYALLVLSVEAVASQPVLGVAVGSACALLFNYLANKRWVFRVAS